MAEVEREAMEYDVVIVGGGMSAENERGDNWVEAMVERSIAAMTDLDCLALLG